MLIKCLVCQICWKLQGNEYSVEFALVENALFSIYQRPVFIKANVGARLARVGRRDYAVNLGLPRSNPAGSFLNGIEARMTGA